MFPYLTNCLYWQASINNAFRLFQTLSQDAEHRDVQLREMTDCVQKVLQAIRGFQNYLGQGLHGSTNLNSPAAQLLSKANQAKMILLRCQQSIRKVQVQKNGDQHLPNVEHQLTSLLNLLQEMRTILEKLETH